MNAPTKLESVTRAIRADSDQPERRLILPHENVRKFGTVYNTVAPGTQLSGVLHRKVGTQ